MVWDNDTYDFLEGDAPDTVNPSLWRQSTLVATDGLFEVVPGLYQVRGMDLSNISFVEGETGVIVIDPLISTETAAAALALYREHRGDRPVTGVIYTHCHVDHFGGVKGVTTQEDVDAGTGAGARAGGIRRARGLGERLRRHRDGPTCRLHVRRRAAARSPRGARRRPRADHVDRHGDPDPADPRDHHDRAGGGRRRRPDGLPDGAGHRGAGGDALLLPRPQGAVRGRGRDPQPAQPAHPARRAGARPARVVEVPDRDHRPVRRRGRGRLRLPPLADLGQRAGRRVPDAPARPLRLPPRPDAADAQQGTDRARRSPSRSRCRPRSRTPGTPAATTGRSATT